MIKRVTDFSAALLVKLVCHYFLHGPQCTKKNCNKGVSVCSKRPVPVVGSEFLEQGARGRGGRGRRARAALELVMNGDHGAAGGACGLPAGPKDLAHLALKGQADVRCNPENVSLGAVHDWSVGHGGLKPCSAAEAKSREGRDVETVPPNAI